MKEKTKALIKKRGLLIWIIMMGMILSQMMLVFADYPALLSSIKRVVKSESEKKEEMFSSNILIKNGDHTYAPQYKKELEPSKKSTGTYDVDVYLWNYSLKDIFSRYEDDIDYTLAFQFVNSQGVPLNTAQVAALNVTESNTNTTVNNTITITDDSGNSAVLSSNCISSSDPTIAGDAILSQTVSKATGENHLKLSFSGNWNLSAFENICIQVTAKLDRSQGKYTDISDLGAVIGLKEASSTGSSGWFAYLNENRDGTSVESVEEYDGFNIVAEGSGTANITVWIDTDDFGINKNFYSISEADFVNGTLTISANSNSGTTDFRNRYNIQLYKTGNFEPSDWDFIAIKKDNDPEPSNWAAAKVKVTVTNIAQS